MLYSLRRYRLVMLFCFLWMGLLPALGHGNIVHAEAPTYADLDGYKLNEVSLTGSHNTYDKYLDNPDHTIGISGWEYYYDALEAVQVIELDFYNFGNEFDVAHDFPLQGSENNCPKHGWPGSTRHQDLDSCIQALRYWHDLNPNHPLVIVKLEPKIAFAEILFNGPAKLDHTIAHAIEYRTGRLDANGNEILEPRIPPELIFKPKDLLCKNRPTCSEGYYADLAEAVEHNNWPTLAELRGKFMFTVVPGTANAKGPRQYAEQLRNQSPFLTPPCNQEDCTDAWLAFPAVFALHSGDPIDWYLTGYACAPLDCGDYSDYRYLSRWFVVLDFQSGRVFDGTVPESMLDSYAAKRYLMFATYERPNEPPFGGPGVPTTDQARINYNTLIGMSNANVVDTDAETSFIPFAKARGRLDPPETGPLYDLTGAGLALKDYASNQCLGAEQFGSRTALALPCPPMGSATNTAYRGMAGGAMPAYEIARASDLMRFSVAYNVRGEMRIGGFCLTATPGNLDGGAVALSDCPLLIGTGGDVPETPAQQRWRIDAVSGKVYTGVDENFCLARLAPSGAGFSLGTRPCAAVSGVWKFASRGPLEPPVGDQMIRLVNPADPYKEPLTPESCLTADYAHLPLSRVWFQPCTTPALANQLWEFNDVTGMIRQKTALVPADLCLEVSRTGDYAYFHDSVFVLSYLPDELALQDLSPAYSWQDGKPFPSYYPRRGTTVGHRVFIQACDPNNPQQHFGWSADERRLIGADGHVLFHDFWGGLRHRLGGTNRPRPGDLPLLEDIGDDRPLASAMNERLAGEVIYLVVMGLPPVALCRNVSQPVDNNCMATVPAASIDAGSYVPGGGNLSLSLTPPGPFGLGQTSVTLQALTELGLANSCQAVVTTVDTTPPSLTLNGVAAPSLQCGMDVYVEAGSTANDNCSVNLPVTIGGNGVNTAQVGTYDVTYNASDAAGNAAAQLQRTVSVIDTFAPVLTLQGNAEMTLQCGVDAYSEAGATSADACTPNVPVTIGGSVNSGQIGIYPLNYSAIDTAGNAATPLQRTINVIDTIAPQLSLEGSADMTLQCAIEPYAEPGVRVIDACSPNAPVSIGGSVNTMQIGTYELSYNVTDTAGQSATPVQRRVKVTDTVGPLLTLHGDAAMTLQCGVDSYVEPGATAIDACSASAPVVITGDTVDATKLGNYQVTYNASDLLNNPATPVQRSVSVVDTLPPLLACPAPVTVAGNSCGGVVVEYPPATATDACQAALTVSYSQASGTFFPFGTTTVVVDAKDGSNNQASCNFGVKVLTLQEQTQQIIDQVKQIAESNALNKGQTNSLVQKLEGVIDALNKDNLTPACNKVSAFVHEVQALKMLTTAQKELLIAAATTLQSNMGCDGGNSCGTTFSSDVTNLKDQSSPAADLQPQIFVPYLHR